MGLTNNTGKLSNTLTSNGTQITLGGSTVTDGNLLNIIGNQSSVNVGVVFNNTNGTYPKIYGLQNVNNNFVLYDYSSSAARLTISNTGAATFSSFVGINGSPATAFPLEAYINSSTAYTSSSRGNVMRVYNSNTGSNVFAGIELGGAGTANDGLAGINAVVTGSGSAALTFYTRDSNTFSEKLRIASSGNVLIGSNANSADTSLLTIKQASTAYNNGIYLERGGERNGYFMYIGGALDALTFRRNYFGTQSDVMSLTRDGNVGIGTSAYNYRLAVYNSADGTTAAFGGTTYGIRIDNGGTFSSGMTTIFGVDNSFYGSYQPLRLAASTLLFSIGTDEKMRITSGGKVLVGTSSTISANYAVQASSNGGFVTNASNSGDASFYSTTGTVGWHFYAEGGGSTRMYVLQNGDVRNANNSYGAISDISLKENITDATPKLQDLLKVKVRNYNFIADETKTKQIGVIAQELEEVFPNMISEDKQMGSDETIKTVKYSVFVPMLIKAIQEQQEIINQLSAKVTALENR